MHGDRPTGHGLVLAPECIRPRLFERDGLVESRLRQFSCEAPDGVDTDATTLAHRCRGIFIREIPLGQQLERGYGDASVGKPVFANHPRRDVDGTGLGQFEGLAGVASRRAQRIAVGIARNQAVIGCACIANDQVMCIGVANQIVEIDAIRAQQFVDEGTCEQAIGARIDRHPFVGDGAVTGAHRIDGDDLGTASLELAEAQFDRIGVVVLGHAPQHQVTGQFPIRLAEFPEAAAEAVHAGRGHVDRAEAAVCGVVDGAELLRPPAGQGLRLVAPGEEGQLIGIALADVAQPLRGEAERLFPFDLAKLAGAALAHAQQGFAQARRRVMLLDAGRTLGTDHAAVDRMLRIAVDVADLAVLQVHADATPARAHVARGGLDLVAGGRVQGKGSVWHATGPGIQEPRMVIGMPAFGDDRASH